MHLNFLAILVAAIIPMALGMVWYNPKVFGTAWIKESGMMEEKAKSANMALTFGLSFFFCFLLAFEMQFLAIHQYHIVSAFFDYKAQILDASTSEGALFKQVMDLVGMGHRTFAHGALHGTIAGITIALPITGVNALFEMKSFKYIFINAGYWIVSMALMGGILSFWM